MVEPGFNRTAAHCRFKTKAKSTEQRGTTTQRGGGIASPTPFYNEMDAFLRDRSSSRPAVIRDSAAPAQQEDAEESGDVSSSDADNSMNSGLSESVDNGDFPDGERDASQEPRVEHFIVDFEDDMWGAIRSVFPNCTKKRCAFHLTQAIFKKIQKLGLQPACYEKGGACELVGKLMVLQLLPAQRITRAFDDLRHQTNHSTILKLIQYMEREWLGNSVWTVDFRPSTFGRPGPTTIWKGDKMVSMNRLTRRTNNDLEGYHTRLNKKAQHTLGFYLLVDLLCTEAQDVSLQANMVSINRLTRYRRRPLQSKVFTRYHARELNTAKRHSNVSLQAKMVSMNRITRYLHRTTQSEDVVHRFVDFHVLSECETKQGKRVNPNVIQEASRQYKQLETENPGLLAELKEQAKINKKTTLEDLNKDEKEQEAQRLYREICKTILQQRRNKGEGLRDGVNLKKPMRHGFNKSEGHHWESGHHCGAKENFNNQPESRTGGGKHWLLKKSYEDPLRDIKDKCRTFCIPTSVGIRGDSRTHGRPHDPVLEHTNKPPRKFQARREFASSIDHAKDSQAIQRYPFWGSHVIYTEHQTAYPVDCKEYVNEMEEAMKKILDDASSEGSASRRNLPPGIWWEGCQGRPAGDYESCIRAMPTTQPALRAYTARHSGVRARGRPRRRWIDGVAETLRAHGMTLREVTHLAVEPRDKTPIIILDGYQEHIEKEVFALNPGFRSRFHHIVTITLVEDHVDATIHKWGYS
ncbi:hypothetical protein Bbelb_200490 [Branchiostoma belcheri]|nr:hypothetical protein Bbelb_200490 [Branchiostoma belcheri]